MPLDVLIANKGKHGEYVTRSYPRSRVKSASSMLRTNPRSKRKGGRAMPKTKRKPRRRTNSWYNDRAGHKRAAKKGVKTKRRKKATRSRAAKAAWRKRKARYGKAGVKKAKRRVVKKKRVYKKKRKTVERKPRKRVYKKRVTRTRKPRNGRTSSTARKAWRTRKRLYGPSGRKGGVAIPKGHKLAPGGSFSYAANPKRRKRRRRNSPLSMFEKTLGKVPMIGPYFQGENLKVSLGIGAGILLATAGGRMVNNFLLTNLTFLQRVPYIVRPISILIVGGAGAYVLNRFLKKPQWAKYVFLGAGGAAAAAVIDEVLNMVMPTGSVAPVAGGAEDYVQYGDPFGDQYQVEAGMLGMDDYVQMAGLGGMPGMSDQAAVEAGLLNGFSDYVQMS